MVLRCLVIVLLVTACSAAADRAPQALDERLHHLRTAGPREWAEFPQAPDAARLEIKFAAARNAAEQTLHLRQQDVKQAWHVSLNGNRLAQLVRDENDMVAYFAVPPRALADGQNVLRIEQAPAARPEPDDIRVGQIALDERPLRQVLEECTAAIEVIDADTKEYLPCRLTIVDGSGALQTVGAATDHHLAVRQGVIYTADGRARFGLPAGRYTVYAGRGFEYSLDQARFTLAAGETLQRTLSIRREVPTPGYIACDTHVHTLTHSGHGDATVEERMITLAGEGIELPIATDHNVQIDHEPYARKAKVRQYFTPVIGNEVTTAIGHFNVFPVRAGARPPDHKLRSWQAILEDIYRTPDVKVAILNHARDLHAGTRPFGSSLFNAVVGENLDGWPMRFNAMEVVNSGATQTDALRLLHDWMALLNRGRQVTPVGSSDSHDVARYIVGQGRTYIRCDDSDAGRIDVEAAVSNFLQGRVMVSYGLLTELTVAGKYGPGELATVPDGEVQVGLRVLGPHWVRADHVQLFANGKLIREEAIDATSPRDLPAGVKWAGTWALPKPNYDVHLVAIATGPGVEGLYWRTAKPYQPTSPKWEPRVIGCSGAVWLDVDGDGRKTSAYDYAQRPLTTARGDLAGLVEGLRDYDAAVAAQAAHQFQSSGGSLLSEASRAALETAAPAAQEGFRAYLDAWRENQIARARR
jgi:hypothetical protein